MMDTFSVNTVLLACAATSAGAGGLLLSRVWMQARSTSARKRQMRAHLSRRTSGDEGLSDQHRDRAMAYAQAMTRRLSLGVTKALIPSEKLTYFHARFFERIRKAGMAQSLSPQGLCEASLRFAGIGAVVGALCGAVFSTELSIVGLVGGLCGAAMIIPRSLRRTQRRRLCALERSLSEMLEVVSLGLRSGLSFDRSFQLYGQHFKRPFAQECSAAYCTWSAGLSTRETALRELAQSYDSSLLSRVVENCIRSIRFGSSLAESLEAAALEARVEHRAGVEERVAKAPVKMMMPTGALILPAMLMLVLGPVLLELMEGF